MSSNKQAEMRKASSISRPPPRHFWELGLSTPGTDARVHLPLLIPSTLVFLGLLCPMQWERKTTEIIYCLLTVKVFLLPLSRTN